MTEIVVILLFALAAAMVISAARSPRFRIRFVHDVGSLRCKLSVRIAALSGFLGLLVPSLEQIQQALPTVEAIDFFNSITQSHAYQTAVACLALFVVVARAITTKPEG